jgi:hypothetical protein
MFKVAMMGDIPCRNALFERIKTGKYSDSSTPTANEFALKTLQSPESTIKLQFYTVNNEAGKLQLTSYDHFTNAYYFCFDLTEDKERTRNLIRKWMEWMTSCKHQHKNPPCLFVGLNADDPHSAQWTPEELNFLARKNKAVYYPASVRTGYGIDPLIQDTAHRLMENNHPEISLQPQYTLIESENGKPSAAWHRLRSLLNNNYWNDKGNGLFFFNKITPKHILLLRADSNFSSMQRTARDALASTPLYGRHSDVHLLYQRILQANDENEVLEHYKDWFSTEPSTSISKSGKY